VSSHRKPDRALYLNVARTCTYFNIRKATRLLADTYDDVLRPFGLRGAQFSLLSAIVLLEEDATVSRLAEAIAADRTTLTRTLAPLERDGLILSETGADRRQRRLSLTPAGEELLVAATAAWEQAQESVITALGTEAWNDLVSGARAVHALNPQRTAG
jgi:DNA-binding MarR family transcriptional regulator